MSSFHSHRFRIIAANNEIVASGEGYKNRADAQSIADRLVVDHEALVVVCGDALELRDWYHMDPDSDAKVRAAAETLPPGFVAKWDAENE